VLCKENFIGVMEKGENIYFYYILDQVLL